jgi:AraC family transcriptional regulator, regulatory protein of adaptative response / methylated-DNA-[protein]-cysteine methyltransferase
MPTANAPKRRTRQRRSLFNDEARWQAVVRRDKKADGAFIVAVKTTGIYCRPWCPSRRPRRENVEFYATPADAQRAGFRPCKRCRPNASSHSDPHNLAVSRACRLIESSNEPPGLAALADAVGMSPSHFHRLFKSLTGLTPKAYASAQRSRRVKRELQNCRTVTAAVYNAGFNSNGPFYSKSKKLLGMTPTSYREGGVGTAIRYAIGKCSLGSILIAASDVGVCAIKIGDDPKALVRDLEQRFPKAELIGRDKKFEKLIAQVIRFVERPAAGLNLPLDIQGTAFQQRVWQKLCAIPCGQTATYTEIARRLNEPKAVRAVARACATNELALAIPCHRVVRTDGSLAGYRWGIERKSALLERERTAK